MFSDFALNQTMIPEPCLTPWIKPPTLNPQLSTSDPKLQTLLCRARDIPGEGTPRAALLYEIFVLGRRVALLEDLFNEQARPIRDSVQNLVKSLSQVRPKCHTRDNLENFIFNPKP
jgi:hypothetical protein